MLSLVHRDDSMLITYIEAMPYHDITAIPTKAATVLKTNATIPLAVNPAGKGDFILFCPLKSVRSSVLAAALPIYGVLEALQTCVRG